MQGIPLQVSLSCPSCHQPVHIQGMGEVQVCSACSHAISLPVEAWVNWFGPAEIAEALTLPDGEARQVTSLGGTSAKYAYGHRMPRCQACKVDVPADRLAELAAAGGYTCPCGQHIRVREAPELAKVVVPGARWLVHEGATGTDATEPVAQAEPLLFQCMGCGGSLEIDGRERTVKCRFCGGSNFLPDGLWLRLHPPSTVQTFFVVADMGDTQDGVPVALLERLAASDDYSVRQAAASNPALPEEVMERLCHDDDSDVRTALAGNPGLPTRLLTLLAKDEDDDIRKAVATNPRTPMGVVSSLVRDSYWGVRQAALQTGRVPDNAVAAQVKVESDNDVLQTMLALPLGPETLRALAASERYRSRVIAAGHADTPPDVLEQLASDGSSDVREALVGNPALPPAGVLQLAGGDGRAATLAQQRPEYAAAASSRRRRRVFGAAGVVSVLVCLGAGTGALGALGMAARWAMRHL